MYNALAAPSPTSRAAENGNTGLKRITPRNGGATAAVRLSVATAAYESRKVGIISEGGFEDNGRGGATWAK